MDLFDGGSIGCIVHRRSGCWHITPSVNCADHGHSDGGVNVSDKEREKIAGGRELPKSESNRMIVRRERLCLFPCLCNVERISGGPSYLRWC